MTADTLDFTNREHHSGEWISADGDRFRFLDRSTGTGFHRWNVGARQWEWHGVMVFDGGPFAQCIGPDELGEDADWDDEGWVVEV